MKEKARKIFLLVLMIAGITGLSFAGYFLFLREMDDEKQSAAEKIVIGVETSFLTAPVWVADDKGYFRDEGIELAIKEFDSGKASFEAMLAKKDGIDVCTVAQTPIMFRSFERDDFLIIAAIVHSYNDVKMLARKDASIKTASDLNGKKVGVTRVRQGNSFLDLFLLHTGLSPSDIEVTDLGPTELPEALANGSVDTICTWEPNIINAKKKLGKGAFVLPSEGIYREDFYLVAGRSFVENNAETTKAFLSTIRKGQNFIRDRQDTAIDIVSQRLALDKKQTQSIWEEFIFKLMLDQSVLISLEDEARWAIKNKFTDEKETPNFLNLIYTDALAEIDPDAMSVIR